MAYLPLKPERCHVVRSAWPSSGTAATIHSLFAAVWLIGLCVLAERCFREVRRSYFERDAPCSLRAPGEFGAFERLIVLLIDVTRQMCAAGRMDHSKGLVAHLLVVGAGAWHGGTMRCDSDLTITYAPASRDATRARDATPYR